MKANLENIIIVANNLVNNEMADVILASLLATTSPGTYPTSDILGEAIFHLDAWDYPLYAYFNPPQSFRRHGAQTAYNHVRYHTKAQ